jgi:hypothetical protein
MVVVVLSAGCAGTAGPELEKGDGAPPVTAVVSAAAQPSALEVLASSSEPVKQIRWPVPAVAEARSCASQSEQKLGNGSVAYAGTVKRRLTAYTKPGGRSLGTFDRYNVNDYPMIFGVRAVVRGPDCRAAWYRVQLPIRPNGIVGYVRASAIELTLVRTRIAVDLSDRRLKFFRDGELILDFATAVGAPTTPTPTGRYYVNQRLIAPDPSGPHGPAALGISAFSPVLIHWPQGGPIAIHGTNNPSSIGRPVSNGCIRLSNKNLIRLFEQVPAGTPVVIRA